MKRVKIFAPPGYIRDPERYDIAGKLMAVGANTGNLIFQHAVTKFFDNPKEYIAHSEHAFDRDRDDDAGSVLVFPLANHLRLNCDWSSLCHLLETARQTIVILGLGAQSPRAGGDAVTIQALKGDPNIVRFAAALRDKASFVSVRGTYTAEVCEALGIRDTTVLGCPSLMINPAPSLGRQVSQAIDAASKMDNPRVALAAAAPFEIRETPKQAVERKLFKWVRNLNGVCYQQSGGTVTFALAAGDFSAVPVSALLSIRKVLDPDCSLDDLLEYFRHRVRIRLDARQWINEKSAFHLVFGTRLHGNLAGLAAGVPGIIVPHDSRTTELAHSMHLPQIDSDVILAQERLQDALLAVNFNADEFDRSRSLKAAVYCAAFEKIGLVPAAHLRALAQASGR